MRDNVDKKDILKDEAVALAESTRDTREYTGFLAGLLEGKTRFETMFPFPLDYSVVNDVYLNQFKKFLAERVDPEKIDADGEIPDNVIDELRKIGAFGIKIPKEHGGLGLAQSEYKKIAVLIGSWDANLTALLSAANSIGVGQPLMHFGTPEQIKRFASRLAAGAISAFALTEPEAGSDLTRINTYALRIREDDEVIGYQLNGKKLWITNATKNDKEFLAELLVVIARIVDNPRELYNPQSKKCYGAFIVETSSPGMNVVQRCHFMGLRALYSGLIDFNSVYVPRENLLYREGQGIQIALSTLAIGRLTLPAACLGAMKQIAAISRWWGRTRKQWSDAIGNHGQISKKIVDMAAHTLALEAIVNITCHWVDQKKDVRLESAACKILGSEWLNKAVDDALQIRSGRGYETADSLRARGEDTVAVERMYRDNRINLIFEGTNQVMRLWQAREELAPYVTRGMALQKGSLSERTKALLGIISRFCTMSSGSLPNIHLRLKRHLRFVQKEARKLTRTAIMAAGAYQQGLASRQLVLARISEVAMELFAISATVAYAQTRMERSDANLIIDLADYFCWEARKRITPIASVRRQIFNDPNQRLVRKLSQTLLSGTLAWLEDGILPMVSDTK